MLRGLSEQLEGLKKQARQANRYRRLSDHIRRAEAVVLHLRWQRAVAEHETAAARFRAAEIEVADRTSAALAAEREREAASGELPALRQTEASAGAELQRLVLARQALEEEDRRVAAARQAATARLDEMASDIAREEALAADAKAALERLEAERQTLAEAQAEEGAAQERAAAALAAVTEEVATLDAELTRLTAADRRRGCAARRARPPPRRECRARRAPDRAPARTSRRRSPRSKPRRSPPRSRPRPPRRCAVAEAEVARTRAGRRGSRSRAAPRARGRDRRARAERTPPKPHRAKLWTERNALIELLAAMGDKRYSPVLDAVTVESGYEAALGAALGEDLTAPIDATAPAHWFALPDYAEAQTLPGDAAPLSSFVTAPPALARRLAQIGVVDDRDAGERLQEWLKPGQRLVSRDGGLWRWDGFRRSAGTPTAAAQRLRQRNRVAELDTLLTDAERELSRTVAMLRRSASRRAPSRR